MQFTRRLYKDSDYEEVKRWYAAYDEGTPSPSIFPSDSTLLLEANGTPVFCLIVYLTNCKEICYLEGFIGNPDIKGSERLAASERMKDEAISFAQERGYRHALTFAYREGVKRRIKELGFEETLENLSCFVKRLS